MKLLFGILTFFFLVSSCATNYRIMVWRTNGDKDIVNYSTRSINPMFQIMYTCLEDHEYYHHIEKVNCNYYLAEIKRDGGWLRPCCVYIAKDVHWYEVLSEQ